MNTNSSRPHPRVGSAFGLRRCRSFPPGATRDYEQCVCGPRHTGPHHNIAGQTWPAREIR